MRTSHMTNYALRLNFAQIAESAASSSSAPSTDKVVTRSAAMLAAFGIALSSFSVKQMLNSSPKITVPKL